MPFAWNRTNPARSALGTVDDSAFTDSRAWQLIWRDEYRAARAAGISVRGRVRVAANLARRVFNASAESTDLHWIVTLSAEMDGLEIWIDKRLAVDTAILD